MYITMPRNQGKTIVEELIKCNRKDMHDYIENKIREALRWNFTGGIISCPYTNSEYKWKKTPELMEYLYKLDRERDDFVPTNWIFDEFATSGLIKKPKTVPQIEKVVFNNPATIVWFNDGDKVVVKTHNEEFDEEKGLAMAIMRKLYGRAEFNRILEGATRQEKVGG